MKGDFMRQQDLTASTKEHAAIRKAVRLYVARRLAGLSREAS